MSFVRFLVSTILYFLITSSPSVVLPRCSMAPLFIWITPLQSRSSWPHSPVGHGSGSSDAEAVHIKSGLAPFLTGGAAPLLQGARGQPAPFLGGGPASFLLEDAKAVLMHR